jgi:predicted short-subunit dehydrogenase-like oxidoreductase (DUF2520 family)
MNISILGSGNMAFFLARSFYEAGHRIVQVYARRVEAGVALSKETDAEFVPFLREVRGDADVYIFAVPDDAVAGLSAAFSCPGKIALHCSGSLPPQVLESASALQGVVWPLYSIRKDDLPQAAEVPFIVDAGDEITRAVVSRLVESISPKVYLLDTEQRKLLHLAAVLSNNFVNHLLSISGEIVAELKLPKAVLSPILQQTFEGARSHDPAMLQTGPAIRHDEGTVERHLALLKAHPEWQDLYQAMTRSIQQFYADKKKSS